VPVSELKILDGRRVCFRVEPVIHAPSAVLAVWIVAERFVSVGHMRGGWIEV
jgi:hypothetical protein